MRFLRQFLSHARQPPARQYTKMASATGATAGLSMAAYACNVSPHQSSDKDLIPDARAHHVKNRNGETVKFQNPHPSHADPPIWGLMSLLLFVLPRPQSADKAHTGLMNWPQPKIGEKLVPVVEPHFLPTRDSSSQLRATWLGHACYYVEFASGLRVLFDPVFQDHCAPIKSQNYKRYTEPPCKISDLPFVDAVVISHSHYDHLSYPSVREIQRNYPNAHFFVGLGLEKWFRQGGLQNVTEMDWWDEADVTFTPQAAKGDSAIDTTTSAAAAQPITARIICLPSQHASGRTAFDKNHTLWASWAVRSGSDAKTVWFAGDTGYRTVPKVAEGVDDYGPEYQHLPVCPQFRQIGERLGSIDLGLIPIGAYDPRHVFSPVHANPFDAVEMFRDSGCKRAMAIHWGTWALTPEDPLEPPKLLREALRRRRMGETGVFDICDIGESREF
ncbi:Uu.00g126670.m01.CDS01 [Anthostomella pinea]|uniref:Uu.00g126670.m01.CDS01 n=1 Tax=Anthostomella pinea TaxID=933095 RepID=A0AAI8VHX5_9PEZI|nr:Uu.00g126670.m01.CDS01 [Anthostomella pinea]